MKIDTSIVDKAIIFATKCHKNTSRKGKTTPYILHTLGTMSIVASMTDDYEIIAAAALHDVVEDTDCTIDEIEKEFGKRVRDIVASESENTLDNYENLNWKEKKQKAIDRLKESSIEIKIVALADKLSNVRDMYSDYCKVNDKLWTRFKEPSKELHKWRFNELTKCFKELEDSAAYKEFKIIVDLLFNGA